VFDLYPRHSHRTPQQIAEDTGGTFEPTRPYRHSDGYDGGNGSDHGVANRASPAADPNRKPDESQTR